MQELDLRLSHVKKSYNRPVLTDINLHVTNDSYVTILGKSGSGKSTMLNILGLVEDYDAGEYYFNDTLIRKGMDYSRLRLHNIGFIFQSYNLIPTLSCKENILLPVMYGRNWKQENFDRLVTEAEIRNAVQVGRTKLLPLIETAEIVMNIQDAIRGSSRIIALLFGGEDYLDSIWGKHLEPTYTFDMARAFVVMAARMHNILPIDTPYLDLQNRDGFLFLMVPR